MSRIDEIVVMLNKYETAAAEGSRLSCLLFVHVWYLVCFMFHVSCFMFHVVVSMLPGLAAAFLTLTDRLNINNVPKKTTNFKKRKELLKPENQLKLS